MKNYTANSLILYLILAGSVAYAQDEDPAAAMARKAQDPLGNVKAVMTDNTIATKGGPNDDVTYGFSIQPVYAIPGEDRPNMILRAVIPVIGVEPGVVLPKLGPQPRPSTNDEWGLSDSIVQLLPPPSRAPASRSPAHPPRNPPRPRRCGAAAPPPALLSTSVTTPPASSVQPISSVADLSSSFGRGTVC